MTWGRQVVHVLRKDLRQHGWLAVLFVAAVGATTAYAAGWVGTEGFPPSSGRVSMIWRSFPLLPGLAMLLVVLAVQSDSPTRSDAFWATRPLAPSAVLVAKLLFALALLWVVPMAGQAVALVRHGVGAERIAELLGSSGVMQGGMLAAFAVLAALTPDLRTFVVAAIGAFFGWTLLSGVAAVGLPTLAWLRVPFLGTPGVRSGVWLTLGLAALAYTYRSRDARRAVRATIAAALVGVLALRAIPDPQGRPGPELDEIPTNVRPGDLRVVLQDVQPNGMPGQEWWNIHLELSLPEAPAEHRFRLLEPRVELTLDDGSVSHPSGAQSVVQLNTPLVDRDGFRWVDDPDRSGRRVSRRSVASFTVRDREARALREGRGTLKVMGLMEVSEPWTLGSVPLRRGVGVSRGDLTYRLANIRSGAGTLALGVIRERVVGGLDWGMYSGIGWDEPEMALVHPARGEAIRLGASGRGTGYRPLVLPGARVSTFSYELSPFPGDPRARVEDEWLRGAELLVGDWRVVGRYGTEADVVDILGVGGAEVLRLRREIGTREEQGGEAERAR